MAPDSGSGNASGADVVEDSPRGAEKLLLECPWRVEGAETELCCVLAPSGLSRPCKNRRLDGLVVLGIFRISCFRAGS